MGKILIRPHPVIAVFPGLPPVVLVDAAKGAMEIPAIG